MGKTKGAHRLQTITMSKIQQRAQRQQPLSLNLRPVAVTTETQYLYRSLSLSLTLTLCPPITLISLYTIITTSLLFALGHIYTNMIFGLFTNIAPVGPLGHIYIYFPSYGERFSPGLQRSVLTGSSLPGTHIPSGGTEILTGTSYDNKEWLQ